jgi:hypothetical protein
MVKLLSFSQFVSEAVVAGQMAPNINFAPNIAFGPMAENPTPDAGVQDQLNLRTRTTKKVQKRKKNGQQ